MVVEKGNKVSIPADTLGEGKGKKITVQWSQEMRNMTSDYWVSKFTNQTTSRPSVCLVKTIYANCSTIDSIDLVFVQVDMLPKLITKSDPNEHYVFTIDSEWQYGQAKGLSNRFIVYQNTRNKQFMVT